MASRVAVLLEVALAVPLALGGASASAQNRMRPTLESASYFPLVTGSVWVYERRALGGTSQWRVEVTDAVGQAQRAPYHALSGYFPGSPHLVRSDGSGAVSERTEEGRRDNVWYLLGAPVGTSWQMRVVSPPTANPLPDCIDGSTRTIASRREVITTALGELKGVVRVDSRAPCADAGITAEWFAPGIGLVRREETSFAGPIVSELIAYQPGGKGQPDGIYSTSLTLAGPRFVNNLMPPLGPDSLPTLRGLASVHNGTDIPVELVFSGCRSATLEVRDGAGQVVARGRADDGGCCTCTALVPVTLTRGSLALPISLKLAGGDERPLPDGRYGLTVTFDTVGPPALRPAASAPIEVRSVY